MCSLVGREITHCYIMHKQLYMYLVVCKQANEIHTNFL